MLTIYVFHNKKILRYLQYALYRLDKFKTIFIKYRFQNTILNKSNDEIENNDEEIYDNYYFNIFKLYIITHYVDFIRLYENVQNFNIEYNKTIYKFLIKFFFSLINKIKKFEH